MSMVSVLVLNTQWNWRPASGAASTRHTTAAWALRPTSYLTTASWAQTGLSE